jgi:hypothetical protein
MLPPNQVAQIREAIEQTMVGQQAFVQRVGHATPKPKYSMFAAIEQKRVDQQEFVQLVGHVTPNSKYCVFAAIGPKQFPTRICSASGTCYPQISIFNVCNH